MLLAGLYNTFSSKNSLEKAQASLNRLSDSIVSVSRFGESQSYVLTEPQGWFLTYFNANQPVSCEQDSCICICKSQDKCDSVGVCNKVSRALVLENPIAINPTEINFEDDGDSIKITEKKNE